MFVDDDSRDGTADVIRDLAQCDARVRCLQRIGRRGLSTACIEGALASSAPYIAVMDADLQHDERLLPHMLQVLRDQPVDLAVGRPLRRRRRSRRMGCGPGAIERDRDAAVAARLQNRNRRSDERILHDPPSRL